MTAPMSKDCCELKNWLSFLWCTRNLRLGDETSPVGSLHEFRFGNPVQWTIRLRLCIWRGRGYKHIKHVFKHFRQALFFTVSYCASRDAYSTHKIFDKLVPNCCMIGMLCAMSDDHNYLLALAFLSSPTSYTHAWNRLFKLPHFLARAWSSHFRNEYVYAEKKLNVLIFKSISDKRNTACTLK